jgi:4-alpha-glucanotransferase
MYVRKCWVHWPDDVKKRDEKMLEEHRKEYADELNSYKFFQFLFMRQWDLLKIYAHDKGILLFGDAPIYISYDSADVWSNPGLFRLNPDLSMESVAGVPPDYFNAKGQFWNMPLYRWDLMHKSGYKWWISRLKKNLELYDLVRIDHFRAFSKFWEIPGEEKTAVNGKWVEGPGEAFFSVIREHFPLMPFVAEDLGNIDKAVYKLRDEFGLPGMHVLQFAFGDNMPESVHIPHNHKSSNISYTGTHDNNTTQGWLKKEVDKKSLERWEKYIGKPIKIKEAHLEIIRMAYASPTWLTIIPLQDWLGLDEKARMNIPATSNGNWQWRLQSLDIPEETEKIMIEYAHLYARS